MEEKQLAKHELKQDIMNKIILKGDTSGLNEQEKLQYYGAMCERLGIDPMTQPFQLLNLLGKQVLYCTKGGAEQLNKIYGVSHEIKKKESINDTHVVEVRASMWDKDSKGVRFTDEVGIVSIRGMSGDMLVNAMLKSVTKAKRRATLALLGLGMLDETEAETIPNAKTDTINITGKEPIKTNGDTAKETTGKPAPTGNPFQKQVLGKCARPDCGKPITSERVLAKSMERFGKPLCFPNCQNAEEKERSSKKVQDADYTETDFSGLEQEEVI